MFSCSLIGGGLSPLTPLPPESACLPFLSFPARHFEIDVTVNRSFQFFALGTLLSSFFLVGCAESEPSAPDANDLANYAAELPQTYDSGAALDQSDDLTN